MCKDSVYTSCKIFKISANLTHLCEVILVTFASLNVEWYWSIYVRMAGAEELFRADLHCREEMHRLVLLWVASY
jgi:hypothetical protein